MSGPRHASIEIARGLAAVSVVTFHVATLLGQGAGHGGLVQAYLGVLHAGVPVFFAISGFVIGRPVLAALLSGRPFHPGRYALRRAARLLPAYWLALSVLAVAPGLPGVPGPDWWKYYGLLQTYTVAHVDDGLGPAWTLCVELSFYLALPLILLGLLRPVHRRLRDDASGLALTAGLVFSAVLSATWVTLHEHLPLGEDVARVSAHTLIGTWAWFVPGLLLAQATLQPASVLGRLGRRLEADGVAVRAGLAGLAVSLSALALIEGDEAAAQRTTLAELAVAASSCTLMYALRGRTSWRGASALTRLGTVSFGIYLWHQPLVPVMRDLLGVADAPGLAAVLPVLAGTLLASVALAELSWRLVEAPAIAWSGRMILRWRTHAVLPPEAQADWLPSIGVAVDGSTQPPG